MLVGCPQLMSNDENDTSSFSWGLPCPIWSHNTILHTCWKIKPVTRLWQQAIDSCLASAGPSTLQTYEEQTKN